MVRSAASWRPLSPDAAARGSGVGPAASAARTAASGVATGDGAMKLVGLAKAGVGLTRLGLGVAVGFGVAGGLVTTGFAAAAFTGTGWIDTYVPSQTIGIGS